LQVHYSADVKFGFHSALFENAPGWFCSAKSQNSPMEQISALV
jgi:hypothetical protein